MAIDYKGVSLIWAAERGSEPLVFSYQTKGILVWQEGFLFGKKGLFLILAKDI